MAFSKLVPHALAPTDAARLAVEAGVPYIKLCSGTLGSAAEYLAINPRLIVIGRHITSKTLDVYLASANGSPQIAARLFLLDQLPIYGLNPDIKIWEGLNEESFGGPDEPGAIERMRKYALFESERVHILDDLGYGAVIGNFSTGYPEINRLDTRMWDAFLKPTALIKNLNAGKPERFFLGLHEYAAPWMWWFAGNFQTGDCLSPSKWQFPGGSLGDKGWLALRYRQVYTYVLQPRNLVVPLLLTEIGNDRAGGGCPGMPIGAWRVLAEWWKNWNGQSDPIDYWRGTERDPEIYYLNQMIWYDKELQKDAYVKAGTIFTFGTDNPVWNDFRVDNAPKFMQGYLAYLAASGGVPVATFNVGQDVYVTSRTGVPVYRQSGTRFDNRGPNDKGKVMGGPQTINGEAMWDVDWTPNQRGWTPENSLGNSLIPAPTPNTYTQRGKMKPLNHHSLPLMGNPETDSQITNVDGDNVPGAYIVYDQSPRFARGRNWYHTNGQSVEGAPVYQAGWLPCWWGERDNKLEIYPADGKPHPECDQEIVVGPTPIPPVEPVPPVVTWPAPPVIPAGVDLMDGKSFEAGWTTDDKGNQVPNGYALWYTRTNTETMPFGTKHQDNQQGTATEIVSARAMGWGEYVHKNNANLPQHERKGQPQAIVLDGNESYKGMGNIAQAFSLTRKFTGTPGTQATLVAHVSAESQDTPQSKVHPGQLEDDHMLVNLQWGNKAETRNYKQMQARRDVLLPNGQIVDRPWNAFVLTDTFPANGQLEMKLTCQNNWPRTFPRGGNDFFIDKIMVITGAVTPPPDPEPTPVLPPIGTNYTGPEQNAVLDALRQKVDV